MKKESKITNRQPKAITLKRLLTILGIVAFSLNILIFIFVLPHIFGIVREPDIPTTPDSISFATPNMGLMSTGRIPPLMATHRGPTVTISGNVSFEEFKKGFIIISARDYEYRDIASAFLSKPGDFNLEVPLNIGDVFIEAINIQKQNFEQNFPKEIPHGSYPKNPVFISSNDIKGINITLSTRLPPILMSTYKGPTVKINGRVKFKDYKSELILITARSEDNYKRDLPPNVATVAVTSPGKYELTVPINIGKIYIEAVGIQKSDIHRRPPPESPYGAYSKNPIEVKSKDLKRVDITLDNTFANKYSQKKFLK